MILGELTANYMGNKTMICFWVAYNCDYAFKQHGGAPFRNIVHRDRYCIKLCCGRVCMVCVWCVCGVCVWCVWCVCVCVGVCVCVWWWWS